MIYILEGLNGTGKSEVAKAIQARVPAAPIWRPFRTDPDVHWGITADETGQMLKDVGVPLNTFIDDLYVADALATLKPAGPVILDRSMPSGVAYGALQREQWILAHLDRVWDYWAGLLELAGEVTWIQLQAPYTVTRERCEGRWHPNKAEWAQLRRTYEKLIQRASGTFTIHVIHSHDKTPQDIAERVLCPV